MKATAEPPSRAEKAELDIMFFCFCSNEFKILISFNLILLYISNAIFTIEICIITCLFMTLYPISHSTGV